MKLLILLLTFSLSIAFAQSDLPDTPKGNQQLIEKLWVLHIESSLDPVLFNVLHSQINLKKLSLVDELKLREISNSFSNLKRRSSVHIDELSPKEALSFASTRNSFRSLSISLSINALDSLGKANEYIESASSPNNLSKADILDVLIGTPDLAYYNNGEYKDTIKLFLLCRESREFACRFVLKDIFGEFVRTKNGQLWSIPALAKSARNIPFNKTNGQTPTGVHTIDSVMPEANRQLAFGEFRRLKLDWIPSSKSEVNSKMFLPESQHNSNWWRRASIARDVGRLYLRIHGTGKINKNPKSSWYPHMPTSGCVSTREGSYSVATYKDQRVILDQLMRASQLSPTYSNERNIKGVLWVLNIDDKKTPVSTKDLEELGL